MTTFRPDFQSPDKDGEWSDPMALWTTVASKNEQYRNVKLDRLIFQSPITSPKFKKYAPL